MAQRKQLWYAALFSLEDQTDRIGTVPPRLPRGMRLSLADVSQLFAEGVKLGV